ncbi:NAD dependent epimerase/dehydratase family [Acididesulfobacillus acetoxydans]|uniref:NAD dependent epimerase/dehydratase family n=1 Tax=Acididesulfobacillus acetoxydans TaxID=1561005 RepID=A0A8S0W423_9FIRM|nr:NAD-dependent epimerase/dehydratase family protein [Acididesulfobacillus acetoxydans]CAA7602188.1 NAD dependent epimerase/dehydratase family [Acididesulfobacillus acetoxydans]CEJ08744.1 UDP-glucuronic acid decarboxylase 1 [Acididesulfobacillus acetoxydans]
MRVLVTGGAGFIGSHTVDTLLNQDHEVGVLDNFSTGRPANLPLREIPVFATDLRTYDAVARALRSFRPDAVIHLAAQVSAPESLRNPRLDAEVNLMASLNLIDNAIHSGVRRFVFASSAAVFGMTDPGELPLTLSTPTRPLSPYGRNKLLVEKFLRTESLTASLESVILRYSNVYGPRQNPAGEGGVVAKFCLAAVLGEPLLIEGDGLQTRDFVYVEDIARANVLSLTAATGTYLAGSSREHSIQQLAQLFRALKADIHLRHTAARPRDIPRSFFAPSDLPVGWQPKVRLRQGLAKTLAYWEKSVQPHDYLPGQVRKAGH